MAHDTRLILVTIGDVALIVLLIVVVKMHSFLALIADSGGANGIIDKLLTKASPRVLPWAMTLVAMIIGIPIGDADGVGDDGRVSSRDVPGRIRRRHAPLAVAQNGASILTTPTTLLVTNSRMPSSVSSLP
jgi:hypothetical protein